MRGAGDSALPAPFGPSRPNIPHGISRLTSTSARTPFG
jgi:hypothetical protein